MTLFLSSWLLNLMKLIELKFVIRVMIVMLLFELIWPCLDFFAHQQLSIIIRERVSKILISDYIINVDARCLLFPCLLPSCLLLCYEGNLCHPANGLLWPQLTYCCECHSLLVFSWRWGLMVLFFCGRSLLIPSCYWNFSLNSKISIVKLR